MWHPAEGPLVSDEWVTAIVQLVALVVTVLEHRREAVGQDADRTQQASGQPAAAELAVVQRHRDLAQHVDRLPARWSAASTAPAIAPAEVPAIRAKR